jgi:hypothetical protein
MRSEYQMFVSNYMKGRASSNFRANAGLMKEAAAAWRAKRGGGSGRRRNPGGLAVRANPRGFELNATTIGLAAVAAYLLVPSVKSQVDAAFAQLKTSTGMA